MAKAYSDHNHIYLSKQIDENTVVHTIHPIAGNFLQQYFELPIAGKRVITPYYINVKKRKDLNALVGKGTPEEMVLEAKVWAQAKKQNLRRYSPSETRQFMEQVGIGIDCGGLVANTLAHYFQVQRRAGFYRQLKYSNMSWRARIARWLRPATNLSADELTSGLNAIVIDLNQVRPGDLIRGVGKQRNSFHVALVTEVVAQIVAGTETAKETVVKISYVHSHRGYGADHGVRRGEVVISDGSKPWWEQQWLDNHSDGKNYLLENDLLPFKADCGFRRLLLLKN